MQEKTILLDKEAIDRTLIRIAHEILEKNKGAGDIAFIGIRTRGVFLAERISGLIKDIDKKKIKVGALDITLYRDDLTLVGAQPVVHKTEIDFNINDKKIILVDDVLYTGRTIRSALDALVDFGRPKKIELVVLVDRGHRELPIRADYVGKNIPTSQNETVEVRLTEIDKEDKVIILER